MLWPFMSANARINHVNLAALIVSEIYPTRHYMSHLFPPSTMAFGGKAAFKAIVMFPLDPTHLVAIVQAL